MPKGCLEKMPHEGQKVMYNLYNHPHLMVGHMVKAPQSHVTHAAMSENKKLKKAHA